METPLTPLEFMRRTRRLFPNREAVVDGSVRLTYEQFFDRCDRWSGALVALGVGSGDRVAYIAPNTHSNLESFYAVPQIGAVLVPINYRLTADDFAYIIGHSGAKVVCVAPEYVDTLDEIRERIPNAEHFVVLERTGAPAKPGWIDYEETLAELARRPSGAQLALPAIVETDLLTINYTSGTTARPKGVMITHRNAWVNSVGLLVHVHMGPGERYLWTLPMFHANGWTFTWTVTAVGGTHVCLRKVEPAKIFDAVASESVTMFCAAPTVLIGVANAPEETRRRAPRGLRVITAGAPPAAATIGRVENDLGWEIIHVYGLTETAPFITICEPRPEHGALSAQESAVLKARQGVELITSGELKVVGEDGREVPHDGLSIGQIVVRGNVVMKGYFADPDATALAMQGGWFHSGDAAVVHPDGYAEVRDRIKDVIISGGENISSIEVEGTLLQHEAVQEAAVVGMPDARWGEAPHAFVVLRAGATTNAEALRDFVRSRLAHFKCPQAFHFVEELPKTATGKVQKFVLRGRRPGIAVQ
jgi:fatty-acyl-CoA synthase